MPPPYTITPLSPRFRLDLVPPPPPFDPATQAAIDQHWDEAAARLGPALFDGPIHCLAEGDGERVAVWPGRYRLALARRLLKERAGGVAPVRPLGVTGVLVCPEGVVLGLRAQHLALYGGLWEPAPAGGLDRADALAVVLSELEEELGLRPDQVAPPVACALLELHEDPMADLLFRLDTGLSAGAIEACYRAHGSGEYAALAVVALADLPGFLARQAEHCLPALAATLAATLPQVAAALGPALGMVAANGRRAPGGGTVD